MLFRLGSSASGGFSAALLLLIIWMWTLLGRPHKAISTLQEQVYSSTTSWTSPKAPSDPSPSWLPQFPSPAGIYEYETIEPSRIQSLCSGTVWTPGLVFTCDESVGGVGNLRNSILHCVRYAIHAGAAMTVPNFLKRSDEDPAQIRGTPTVPIETIFDRQHYIDTLHLMCPEMTLYPNSSYVPNIEKAPKLIKLLPESIMKTEDDKWTHPIEYWRTFFYEWLPDQTEVQPSEETPVIVGLERSYMSYPAHTDSQSVFENFGFLLQLRRDARLLASEVLYQMQLRFNLVFDQTQHFFENAYFGAHLRTEHDSRQAWGGWEYGRFERQTELYLEQAPRSNSSFIYIASGEPNEIAKFAAIAAEKVPTMPVLSKLDLLQGEQLERLQSMTFDQQGLVDLLVMMRASDFAGIGHSSFAWNVAIKRHTWSKTEKHLDGPQMLSDELSQIYGAVRGYPEYDLCLWP